VMSLSHYTGPSCAQQRPPRCEWHWQVSEVGCSELSSTHTQSLSSRFDIKASSTG